MDHKRNGASSFLVGCWAGIFQVTKAKLNVLEKVFGAEIEGRLFQSNSKVIKALEQEQCVEMIQQTVGVDRFGPVVIEGWGLTHRGRIIYCQWAAEWEAKVLSKK